MRSDLVVALESLVGDLAHVLDRVEQVRRQHLLAVGAVEPLDEGVLIRLARLDEADRDVFGLASLGEGVAGQLTCQSANAVKRMMKSAHPM